MNDALIAVKDGVASLTSAMETVKKWNVDLGLRAEYLGRFQKGQSFFTVDLRPEGQAPVLPARALVSEPFGVRKEKTTITTVTFPGRAHQDGSGE